MHWVELLVMALLGLVVLLTVVRPLVRRVLAPEDGAARKPRSPPPSRAATCRPRSPPAPPPKRSRRVPNQTAKMIDIAQVQGQVHAQSVQRVGELVDSNPTETVSIIRTWLHESAA